MKEDTVLELIYNCVDEVNRQLPSDAPLIKSPATVLVGDGGVLDSLGLITLLVAVEEALESKLGVHCMLLVDEIIVDPSGPYRSIESLAQWILRKTE